MFIDGSTGPGKGKVLTAAGSGGKMQFALAVVLTFASAFEQSGADLPQRVYPKNIHDSPYTISVTERLQTMDLNGKERLGASHLPNFLNVASHFPELRPGYKSSGMLLIFL